MEDVTQPRNYKEWRTEVFNRAEDAAYTFGKHFIKYCRDEIIKGLSKSNPDINEDSAKDIIHSSLHNVMDLFEGYWKLQSGDEHTIEYVLQVVIKNKDNEEIEKINLSPCKLDLPIGFWKWAEDGKFR